MDGEKLILDTLVAKRNGENSILERFAEVNIIMLKLPASSSLVLQPADVATTFRNAKSKLVRGIASGDVLDDPLTQILSSELNTKLSAFATQYKLKDWSETKSKICESVAQVHYAIKNSTKMNSVAKGFVVAGHSTDRDGNFSFYNMCAQKRGDVVFAEVYDHLMKRANNFDIPFAKLHGKLTEEQMDLSNAKLTITREGESFIIDALPRSDGEGDVERDMVLLYKQRAICLTAPASIAAYNAEQGIGTVFEEDKEALAAAKRKASSILLAEARAQDKQKAAALEEERRGALTEKQRADEDKAKKDAVAAKKQANIIVTQQAKAIIAAKRTNDATGGPVQVGQLMDE